MFNVKLIVSLKKEITGVEKKACMYRVADVKDWLGGEELVESPAKVAQHRQGQDVVQSLAVLVVVSDQHHGRSGIQFVAGHLGELGALVVHLVLAAGVKLPGKVVEPCTAHSE